MLPRSIKVLAILAPVFSYASLLERDLSPVTAPAAGWSYQGCYTDSTSARKLDSASYRNSSMTVESCVSYCSSKGYTVAGLEYSTECYCGFNLKSGSTKSAESKCQSACGGAASEPCGGPSYLSVYSNGKPGGTVKTPLNGYSYIGCYTDSAASRALNVVAHSSSTSPVMTQELCTSLCSKRSYKYAGLEHGGECFCGNSLGNSSLLQKGTPQDTGCDYLCKGDSTEWCGGNARLSLYSSAAILPGEQLDCPSFEGCQWSDADSTALDFEYVQSSSLPHSGSYYVYGPGRGCGSGCSDPGTTCIETYPDVSAGAYRLSFNIGGINNFRQDPRCAPRCIPPSYSLTFATTLNGVTYSGPVCEGGCNSTDVAGDPVYNTYSYYIPSLSDYQTLQICATWDGVRLGSDDAFLLDDVSLFGPY